LEQNPATVTGGRVPNSPFFINTFSLAASFFGHWFGRVRDGTVGEIMTVEFPKKPASNRVLWQLGLTKVIEHLEF
jgi:hypothetical protein